MCAKCGIWAILLGRLWLCRLFQLGGKNDTRGVYSHVCFLSGLRKSSPTTEIEGLHFGADAESTVHFPRTSQRDVVLRPYLHRNQTQGHKRGGGMIWDWDMNPLSILPDL